jgi:hypothetical protein
MNDETFFQQWLPLDLTAATSRGEPTWYYVYGGVLHILPPPASARAVVVHYNQRMVDLINPTDPCLTPAHLDEAVVNSVLVRVHKRVHEVQLSMLAEADLQESLDEQRMDEEFEMEEEQERVIPDTGWR